MHEETIWLGPAPAEEDCVQVSTPDYARNAKAECRAYIQAIRAVVGQEPEGARLTIKSQDHDFGLYYEVAVVYDPSIEAAADYASRCDQKAPVTWEQAGMERPAGREREVR